MPEALRKQNLDTKKEMFLKIVPMGLIIGTGFGGYVMRYSRKYTFIILTFVGIVLNSMSLINSMPILFISRGLYGVLGGLLINIVPKIL